jgi:2-aminoadipate transaminase
VAWIAAPAPIAARMEVAKQSIDLCTGSLDQRLAYELHKQGVIDRRIPQLREAYLRKRIAMEEAFRRHLRGAASWTTPKGGFFLWAEFSGGVNTDRLMKRAMARGVLYVPGSAFFVEGHNGASARFSFSAPTAERIETAVQRLAEAVREETAALALERQADSRPDSDRAAAPAAARE